MSGILSFYLSSFQMSTNIQFQFFKNKTFNGSLAKDIAVKSLPNVSKKLFLTAPPPAIYSLLMARDGCRNDYTGSLSGA